MSAGEDRGEIEIPDLPHGIVPGFGKPIMGRRMERFIAKPQRGPKITQWIIEVPKECLDNIEWIERDNSELKELIEVSIMKVPTTGFS